MRTSETPAVVANTVTGLDLLRVPFLAHQISQLPKPTRKDAPKGKCAECGGYHGLPAVHLDYVGHAALTDRLLDADTGWTWEPFAVGPDGLPRFDASGGLWIRLTVCGVSRLGYGNAEDKSYMDVGAREKEVIGDALRNAAMRFGAALDLWHKGILHIDHDDTASAPPVAAVPVAPPGFAEWAIDFASTADSGIDALTAAWKGTRRDIRDHMTAIDNGTLARLKAKASAVK